MWRLYRVQCKKPTGGHLVTITGHCSRKQTDQLSVCTLLRECRLYFLLDEAASEGMFKPSEGMFKPSWLLRD